MKKPVELVDTAKQNVEKQVKQSQKSISKLANKYNPYSDRFSTKTFIASVAVGTVIAASLVATAYFIDKEYNQ